jgi:hypothetical protein
MAIIYPSSSPAVYKISPWNTDSVLLNDLLPETLVQSCPESGQKDWQGWQPSNRWNEMNAIPAIGLLLLLSGLACWW